MVGTDDMSIPIGFMHFRAPHVCDDDHTDDLGSAGRRLAVQFMTAQSSDTGYWMAVPKWRNQDGAGGPPDRSQAAVDGCRGVLFLLNRAINRPSQGGRASPAWKSM